MNYITKSEFDEQTKAGKQVVVFSASWCSPCKMLTPVIENFEKDYSDIQFSKVDIEQEAELTITHGISSVPTIMFFQDGDLKYKHIGASSATILKKYIESYYE